MNKPIIMGTTTHKAAVKASVAKATKTNKSIVAAAPSGPDADLLRAAGAHGKSKGIGLIDYGREFKMGDIPDKEKKPKTKKKWTSKDTQAVIDANDAQRTADAEKRYQDSKKKGSKKEDKKPKGEGWIKKAGKWIKGTVEKGVGGVMSAAEIAAQKIKDKKAQNQADWDAKNQAKNQAKIDAAEKERLAKELKATEEARLLAERKEDAPLTIEPRSIRSLPTKANKEKLQKATATAATREGTNRFEKAAEKFGYDLSTVEGYEEAETAMEYEEGTDEWINPKGTYDPSGKESSKVSKTPEEIAEEKENERLAAEATQKLVEEEETRQAQVAAKREAELLEKQKIKAAEKEVKRVALEEQNIAIRARNEEIRGAKELYGKATKSTIEKYRAAKLAQEQELTAEQTEIYEEDDPEFGEAGYDAAIHGGVEEQEAERKRRLLDTATSIESRGAEQLPTSPPTDVQQPVEMPSYEMPKSEPMIIKGEPISEGRVRKLDKLWKNSQEGGTIRENLRNEGYVPPSER